MTTTALGTSRKYLPMTSVTFPNSSKDITLGSVIVCMCSQVMNEGTIKLVNARHPVLLLRGKAPVGNDMSLDASMQALILTGPNAGDKYNSLLV